MLLPNKTISYKESVFILFPIILATIKSHARINIIDLYKSVKKDCKSIIQFTQSLDCLYALNKIKFNFETGEIEIC